VSSTSQSMLCPHCRSPIGSPILTGLGMIAGFTNRSRDTVRKWIKERDFPAVQLDGVWTSDMQSVVQWHQRQIGAQQGRL